VEWQRIEVQVHEHEPPPLLDAYREQPVVRRIEVGGIAEVARLDECTVEIVGPAVVLADEVGAAPGRVGDERSGAVTAHVW
jgi:hypothetical protein